MKDSRPSATEPILDKKLPQRESARSGSMWIGGGYVLGQILRLAVNVALAAILFEEAFALMAIVSAVMQGLAMFSDVGLRPSVIRSERGDEPDFLNTVWTFQVIRGILLTLMAALLAWPLTVIYAANDPMAYQLMWLIPLVGLTAFIDGLQSSRIMTAARYMQLKRVTAIEFITQLVNAIIIISLAWYMRSVYALAIAGVLSCCLRTALTYFLLDGIRNRLFIEPAAARTIFSFGKWIFVSTVLTFLAIQLDRLVFAGLYSLAEVGVYSIAAGLAMMVGILIGALQGSVVFPWYSRMMEEGMSLADAFKQARAPVILICTYMTALLVVCAQSFFEVAYDDRYIRAATYLQILSVGAWFACLDTMYGAAFLAAGRSKWAAIASATKVLVFLLLLVPLVLFGWGLVAAAVMVAVSELARAAMGQYLGWQMGLRNVRHDLGMLGILAVASLAGLFLGSSVPLIADLHPAVRLVVLGAFVTLLFAPFLIRVALPLLRSRVAPS